MKTLKHRYDLAGQIEDPASHGVRVSAAARQRASSGLPRGVRRLEPGDKINSKACVHADRAAS